MTTTTAANQSYLRALNQRRTLGSVFEHGPVSRAQLARMLKISKPAMADNVSRLIDLGIIMETDENSSPRAGRKPILLRFNSRFRYIVTLDFNYEGSRFDLFDLSGETVNSFYIKQTPHQHFSAWTRMCISAVRTLLSSHNIDTDALAAIGVSSPGIIDPHHEDIIKGPMFGAFNPKALYTELTQEFSCPIYLKNSTNASALGELSKGVAQGEKNIVYVSCGQGLGAGIIVDRRLYEGSSMAAGEIAGFVTPETVSDSLSLEKRICMEGLLARFYEGAPAETIDRIMKKARAQDELFKELVALWKAGDAFLRDCVQDITVQLGCAICNLVMVLNCDMVVLGGEYLAFASHLIPAIRSMVQQHCIKPSKVVAGALQDTAASVGMAAICREMYFDHLCEISGA